MMRSHTVVFPDAVPPATPMKKGSPCGWLFPSYVFVSAPFDVCAPADTRDVRTFASDDDDIGASFPDADVSTSSNAKLPLAGRPERCSPTMAPVLAAPPNASLFFADFESPDDPPDDDDPPDPRNRNRRESLTGDPGAIIV